MRKNMIMIISVIIVIGVLSTVLFFIKTDDVKDVYTDDEIKFKNEYEKDNGVELTENYILKTLNIDSDNNVKYVSDDEIVKLLHKGTNVIYFGWSECNWCRTALPILLKTLKENKIDKMLKEKLDTESVLVGISAGAISYLKSGLSDTEIINNISNNYVKVDGLGFIDYMFVPHFSSDSKKMEDLEKVLKNDKDSIALCTDNCAAIEIIDGHINVVKSDIKAKAYKAVYKDKLYLEEIN